MAADRIRCLSDWRPEWYAVYEGIYFNRMRAGMPTVQAGEKLAQKFRDIA